MKACVLPLQVSILHHSAPVEHVNHMAAQPQYMRPVHHPFMIHTLNSHVSGEPRWLPKHINVQWCKEGTEWCQSIYSVSAVTTWQILLTFLLFAAAEAKLKKKKIINVLETWTGRCICVSNQYLELKQTCRPFIRFTFCRVGFSILSLYCSLTLLCYFWCLPGTAPPAATAVIVVCIAALVVIVVIGVYRIHATHQEESREDEDDAKDSAEDWDKSSLTITVNPMEVCIQFLWCSVTSVYLTRNIYIPGDWQDWLDSRRWCIAEASLHLLCL